MREKINVITLGCSKNLVDSEHLMAQLDEAGYEIVTDSNSTDAKIVVINTCGFIGDAKEEAIQTILECAEAKAEGRIERLFVMGCLSERYADELREEIPEVDDYFGARSLKEVVEALDAEYIPELETDRLLTTPDHYAYLKIGEGCNWHCAYCAIPLIRGNHRSVPMEKIIEEAEGLVAVGVKEIIVIAQDTTYYGKDLYGERKLAELLRRICAIEGVEWVRLHYAYPTDFPQDVIEVLRDEPKMCKYLDIPLQHIADNQLAAMRRRITKEQTEELVARLRREIPDIALRTTMLVGFPGESEEDFEELCEFVERVRFDRLGAFAYSEEEGTPSALTLADDVPDEVKSRRLQEIIALQNELGLESYRRDVGKEFEVLVEGASRRSEAQLCGRTSQNKMVVFDNNGNRAGDYVRVRITDCTSATLLGVQIK